MARRVLILGGGFGGVACARTLIELLDDHDEVILADRGTHFVMGFRKTSAIVEREPFEGGMRPLKALERFGVQVRQAEITRIDPAARAAELDGARLEADALLVGVGAETVLASIPGLAEHGIDWYSNAGVDAAREALHQVGNGHVLIGIFGQPYKCPPAPFELALLANEAARARGAKTTFEVISPLPSSLPVVGPAGCEVIEGRLAGQMIRFRPNTKAERVEPGRVVTDQGDEVPFDVLLAVPPHRVPAVVTDAGLAPAGGWIMVDPPTQATSVDGVWAVGDCVGIPMASGKPMPKAGAFAKGAGEVAAQHIAAFLDGGTSDARFRGDGACFLEAGNGEAMMVRGRFLADGEPDVELTTPSKEFLEEKHRFERETLDGWFGAA